MPETHFTPGPWVNDFPADDDPQFTVESVEPVGLICHGGEDWELDAAESRANAHLIAAAPDLYAALEEWITPLLPYHPDNVSEASRGSIERSLAALAKARGGHPDA